MGGAYSGEMGGGSWWMLIHVSWVEAKLQKPNIAQDGFCLFNQENPLRNENRGISPSLWD